MVGGREGGKERGQGVSVWCLGQLNEVQRVEVMWEWCEFGGGGGGLPLRLCGWGGMCVIACWNVIYQKHTRKILISHVFKHLRTSSQ